MSSKGNATGLNAKLPIGFGSLVVGSPTLLADVGPPRVHDGLGTSTAVLTCAATAVARVQEEIDDLWRDAMRIENGSLSERLVEVSHALQRAARLLEQDRAIG